MASLGQKLLDSFNAIKSSNVGSKIGNSLLNAIPGVGAVRQIQQWSNPVISPLPSKPIQANPVQNFLQQAELAKINYQRQ